MLYLSVTGLHLRTYVIGIDVNSFEAKDACVCLFNDAVHNFTKSV